MYGMIRKVKTNRCAKCVYCQGCKWETCCSGRDRSHFVRTAQRYAAPQRSRVRSLRSNLSEFAGSTLHFATELIGSAFGIKDNPQVSHAAGDAWQPVLMLLRFQAKESGSCGCGISWEAK